MGIYGNNTLVPAVRINQGIIPSGTLEITAGGLYNVYSYNSISVNIQDLLEVRLTGSKLVLADYTDNVATRVNPGAFAYQEVCEVNMPKVTEIGSFAFEHCSNLSKAYFPECIEVKSYAFSYCSSLYSVNLSKCSFVRDYVFTSCYNLSSIDLPLCTTLGNTFRNCSNLISISLPVCTSLGGYVFYYCSKLPSIDLPACTKLDGYNNFMECQALSNVSIPLCSLIGYSCFQRCSILSTLSIPACTSISAGAFSKCYNLLSLYLNTSVVPSLANSNAFTSTPIAGYTTSTGGVYGSIFVPISLYSSFISATNWANYSSRIVSMNF